LFVVCFVVVCLRRVDLGCLPEGVRSVLLEEVAEVAGEVGVGVDDVVVYEYPVVPVRIQHIVNELGRRGEVLVSTAIVEGRLYLLAVRRGAGDLHLAPDYGPGGRR